jgi:protein-tyrosine phosphatase
VHHDDIVADYLLTNDPVRLERRLPQIREVIREATGKVADDKALMTVMRVEAEYLDEAFAVMREQSGSIDGYLDDVLGLDAGVRERLHERLLA